MGPTVTPLRDWIGFHIALLLLLAAELLFSRFRLPREREARLRRQHKNALAATAMWVSAALALALYLAHTLGTTSATQFLAGYAIEQSSKP